MGIVKAWILAFLILLMGAINYFVVQENKLLIKKDVALAEEHSAYHYNIDKCRRQNDQLRIEHDKLVADYNAIKDAYNNLRLGK
jgi:hypothetical protein